MTVMFSAAQSTTALPAESGSSPQSSTAELAQPAAAATDAAAAPSQFAQYVLHPPLPAIVGSAVTSSDQLSAIPLLLNPDILQSSKIPVITPQLPQVRAHSYYVRLCNYISPSAFSASTLMVGQQERHSAGKKSTASIARCSLLEDVAQPGVTLEKKPR